MSTDFRIGPGWLVTQPDVTGQVQARVRDVYADKDLVS